VVRGIFFFYSPYGPDRGEDGNTNPCATLMIMGYMRQKALWTGPGSGKVLLLSHSKRQAISLSWFKVQRSGDTCVYVSVTMGVGLMAAHGTNYGQLTPS
jgi:hypothetical protein